MKRHEPVCPTCGSVMDAAATAPPAPPGDGRYDLEELARAAASEKAYDEAVKVRVTQEDIRKLVEKRRRKRK